MNNAANDFAYKANIKYRLATNEDNEQLLVLTSSFGMMGETGLRIDRNPDFFKLLEMRGDTKVFVALDGDILIGSLCVTLQHVYVGGEIVPLRYIGDFKVATSYRNKSIGLMLCNEMANYILSTGADLAFLNVSKGNTKPVSFFKNRPNVPDFDNIGVFKVHQFIGKRVQKQLANKIEWLKVNDELLSFLNGHYSKYQLGSVITKEKLERAQIFGIRNNQHIVAAICLMDMMEVKQNVVTRLSWEMTCLLACLNFLSDIVGISKMPLLNEPVKMMYIKYLAVNNQDKKQIKLLINYARNIAYQNLYSFVSIGLHEKDPLNKCFSGLFKLTFNSVGMLLSIKNNRQLIEKVKQGIPFEDYSLV